MMTMPLKMIMRIWEPCRRSVWPEDIFNLIVDHVNNFLHLLKQIKFDHFANVPNIFTFNVLVKLWLWYLAALKLDVQSVILHYSDNFVELSFYNIYKKIATSLLKSDFPSFFWRLQNNLSAKYLRQLASTRNWRKF